MRVRYLVRLLSGKPQGKSTAQLRSNLPQHPICQNPLYFQVQDRDLHLEMGLNSHTFSLDHQQHDNVTPVSNEHSDIENVALKVQNLLKVHANKPKNETVRALNNCGLLLSEELVISVLWRLRSDWKAAYIFFDWVSGGHPSGYSPGSGSYNKILDILGRMKRFEELHQVLGEMSKREGLVNERTYGIVLNRYAAAHKVEDATQFFYKRKELGLKLDLIAFQTLLMCLCRYKHVETAEFLLLSKKNEFPPEIKTMNIILNGWCILGSFREAKRFWNDIISSKEFKPDRFTYGIFINSLTKAGKLATAVKLFRAMWEKGIDPDVAICNCIIDQLCFKKRIPEALEIFQEMNERNCSPDVATYNSLIKHLCKIKRMEKVFTLLNEMEQKGGDCLPNARTYGYLLKHAKKPEEVFDILESINRVGCKMTGDTYNLLLRLFMEWGCEERARSTWVEMERDGMGPDQRSYTIIIHGLYKKERFEEALSYFNEMMAKGMVPEPRTTLLVSAMNIKLKKRESERRKVVVKPMVRRKGNHR
ncbi:hypothetical protein NMG60_11025866 [Bertholletia excelsa]